MCQQAVIGMGRRAEEAEALGSAMGTRPPPVFQELHHTKPPQPSAEPAARYLCSYYVFTVTFEGDSVKPTVF